MQRLLLLLLTIFLISGEMFAQPFSYVNSSIHGIGRSYVNWGDYDNDGDLDLAICGEIANGDYVSRIYVNDSGSFNKLEAGLIGVREGSIDWGDFDNDNDLDLLLSGMVSDTSKILTIYRNDDGVFVEYPIGLPNIGNGDAAWGDFDNDGDLDIMMAGSWESGLYENFEGSFINTGNEFGMLQYAKIAWGDFDNDGDLDILLSGDTGGGYLSDIYLNQDGTFIRALLPIEGLFSGSVDMVDFDNDGDLDISITGFDIYFDPRFIIYENLGDGTVNQFFTAMEGIAVSGVDWGDYDNDGDLDIVMAGKNASCGGSLAKVYRYDDGYFTTEVGAQMSGLIRCGAAWADYDNDGDLDYLLCGVDLAENPYTKLYRNEAGTNTYTINTPPNAPEGLAVTVNGQSVTLSWDPASDAETPQEGLTYNVRLGVNSGDIEQISPMSDTETGYRYVQAIGNTNMQTSWTIKGLEQGTYYWSVQAIDHAYSGSAFSDEASFQIIETGINDHDLDMVKEIYPNPAYNHINVSMNGNDPVEAQIMNVSGQVVLTRMIKGNEQIDINGLDQGVYFIQLSSNEKVSVKRFVKE